MELLKTVDSWFLILAVVILGGYFLWSVKGIFQNFTAALERLERLIEKLFENNGDHDSRISALEARCNLMHGESSGGRRPYDPEKRIQPH